MHALSTQTCMWILSTSKTIQYLSTVKEKKTKKTTTTTTKPNVLYYIRLCTVAYIEEIAEDEFRHPISISFKLFLWYLCLVPLMQTSADLRSANEVFVLTRALIVDSCSFLFSAMSPQSLLKNCLHSAPIPPWHEKTRGVKEPCSTSGILCP